MKGKILAKILFLIYSALKLFFYKFLIAVFILWVLILIRYYLFVIYVVDLLLFISFNCNF
ncbi:MAG: hypothetical protein EAZ58_01710 [Flavobacterium sp.]|nr:MAG: hypothetical protein EAZ58_01710 [Flavobacterium sp.]